jgi:hypothetical protein
MFATARASAITRPQPSAPRFLQPLPNQRSDPRYACNAAGVTITVWSMDELLDAALTGEVK